MLTLANSRSQACHEWQNESRHRLVLHNYIGIQVGAQPYITEVGGSLTQRECMMRSPECAAVGSAQV